MKKIIRYMQDTAVSYSNDQYNSAYYLGARGKEPQQHQHRHPQQNDPAKTHSYQVRYFHQHCTEKGRDLAMCHDEIPPPAYTRHTQGIPGEIQRFQYASDNVLQSVEVYIPQDNSRSNPDTKLASDHHPQTTLSDSRKYWILYIHGGYFRDPLVTASSFHRTLSLLLSPSSPNPRITEIQPHIAGYASINYRLSPHERYPQSDVLPTYEKREAKWPEHMTDVLRAISWLQSKYGFGERYLLVGHSVGATMALRACLNGSDSEKKTDSISKTTTSITPPLAVLGVCGIYDFPALHAHWGEAYEYLTRNAGMTPDTWTDASPAQHPREEFQRKWCESGKRGKKRWCLLAASKNDGLVDWGQVKAMNAVFDEDTDSGDAPEGGDTQVLHDVIEIKGKHNEIWEKGEELARCIALGVGEMMGLDQ